MKTIIKFYEKDFVNLQGNLKSAYLKACKWVSSRIVSKEYNNRVTWNISKVSETTIKLTVYAILDISGEKDKFCKICKDFHSSFFINEFYNCNTCKLDSFIKRMDDKNKIVKGAFEEKIKRKR